MIPGVQPFWLYAYGVLGIGLSFLGGTVLLIALQRWRGRSADRLEFVLGVFYSTLFVYTIEACFSVMRAQGEQALAAYGLALLLLSLLGGSAP